MIPKEEWNLKIILVFISLQFNLLKVELVSNTNLPTRDWRRKNWFFWGMSGLSIRMHADFCQLAFDLKYWYIISSILKDLYSCWFEYCHMIWKNDWIWTKDCEKWFSLRYEKYVMVLVVNTASSQKVEISWRVFLGQPKQSLIPQTLLFLKVIGNNGISYTFWMQLL